MFHFGELACAFIITINVIVNLFSVDMVMYAINGMDAIINWN